MKKQLIFLMGLALGGLGVLGAVYVYEMPGAAAQTVVSSEVTGRIPISETRERVLIVVNIDGTLYDYRPWVTINAQRDSDLLTEAEAAIMQRLADDAEAQTSSETILRTEVDAQVARMRAANLVTALNWKELTQEALVTRTEAIQ